MGGRHACRKRERPHKGPMLIKLHLLQLLPIVGVKSAGFPAAGRAAMVKSIHSNQKHDNLYHSRSFHDSINNESMIINPICCPLKWTLPDAMEIFERALSHSGVYFRAAPILYQSIFHYGTCRVGFQGIVYVGCLSTQHLLSFS